MSKIERLVKRRETRTKQRCQEREDLFVSDYVKHKYPTIHEEAVRVFGLLSNQYPNKLDVRKTEEHKAWKIYGTTNMHPAFNIHQATVIPPNAQLRVIFPESTTPEPPNLESATPEPPNPESTTPEPPNPEPPNPEPPNLESATPEPPNPEPPNPEPPSPEPPNLESATPEPPNPEPLNPEPPNLESATPEPPNPEPPNPEPPNPEPPNLESATPEPPNPEPPNPESATPEPPSPKPPTPPKPKGKIPYKDRMQLIIPLIKSPVKHPGVITETLEIITEETLQGNEHLPNLDEIDPKIIDQLISELRTDPDLGSIFTDLEQQLECEELAMDIDIDMDTRLEDELENWEFW